MFNILTYNNISNANDAGKLIDVQTTYKYVTGINTGQGSRLVFSSDPPTGGQPYYSIDIVRDTTKVHDEHAVRDFLELNTI
ncbi:hypothetical protein FACS189449_05260 [Alphaproteobacteria bacterium]|nr:hypothetical protein FACS189449_05260 [Alphaproteobacteria bacterium]